MCKTGIPGLICRTRSASAASMPQPVSVTPGRLRRDNGRLTGAQNASSIVLLAGYDWPR